MMVKQDHVTRNGIYERALRCTHKNAGLPLPFKAREPVIVQSVKLMATAAACRGV